MKLFFKTISEHKYFCFIFIIFSVLFFGDFIFSGKSIFFGDVYWYFIPIRNRISEMMREFEFPVWTNLYDCGIDLLGSSTFALLSFVQVPFYLLKDQVLAYNLIILLSYIILALCSYIFFLYKFKNKISSVFSSILLIFFGFSITNYLFADLMLGFAVMPLCFYFSERFINENRRHFLFIIAIIIAFQIYNGHPQTSVITITGIYLYIFVQMISNHFSIKNISSNMILITISFFLGFGFAAPQLYPLYMQSKLSTRIVFDLSGSISLYPSSLICAVFYNFLGAESENSFIGPPMGHNLDLYLGFLTLFFFIYGLKNYKKNKEIKVYLILLIASLFIALGRFSPVYFIIKNISIFQKFRGIMRYVILMNFFELLIAGWGFYYFIKDYSEYKLNLKLKYIITLSVIFFLIISTGFLIKHNKSKLLAYSDKYIKVFSEGRSPEFLKNLEKGIRKYPYQYYYSKLDRYFDTISNNLIFISFIPIIFLSGLFFLIKYRITVAYLYIFILAVYFFDCREYYTNFKMFIEKNFFTEKPATLEPLLRYISPKNKKNTDYRFYNLNLGNMELPFKFYPGFKKSYEPFYHLKKFLAKNTPVYYGINIFNGENTMETLRFYKVRTPIKYGAYKLLSYSSTKYIYTAGQLPENFFKKLDSGDSIVNFYEYKFPLPRFYFVTDYEFIKNDFPLGINDDKIIAIMNSEEFEYRKKIIIGEQLETEFKKNDFIEKPVLNTECIKYTNNIKSFKINSSCQSFFTLTDTYDPEWECFIDNKKTKIYRANYLFQSIIVPEGNHTVTFKHSMKNFKTGLMIFILSIAAAITINYLLKKISNLK
ncbi:YfhO family protein [Candidatus Dependentiae bacterium]|nr:YfhO family protein [Candidatus Dependentiae bacterium]